MADSRGIDFFQVILCTNTFVRNQHVHGGTGASPCIIGDMSNVHL